MYLSQHGESAAKSIAEFCADGGDTGLQQASGLPGPRSPRQASCCNAKPASRAKVGKTGWIHRAALLARGVKNDPGGRLPEDRRRRIAIS